MIDAKEIANKLFQRLRQSEENEKLNMKFNASYQKGYADALFWVLDMELSEVNSLRVVIEQ